MKFAREIAAALVILGGLFLAYRHFFPNEEQRIRRRLDDLAATVSIPAQASPARTLLALNKLKGFFAPNVTVDVDTPFEGRHAFEDRDELMQAAAAAWTNLRDVKVEFLDINVKLGPSNDAATAELTARVARPGNRDAMVQEFRLTLGKQDGEWLITRAESVRVLR